MAKTILEYPAAAMMPAWPLFDAGDGGVFMDFLNQTRQCWRFASDDVERAIQTQVVEMPTTYTGGTLKMKLLWIANANTGAVQWEAYVEAITEADAFDIYANQASWDSANTLTETVSSTLGYLMLSEITLTNKDSVAVGDSVRFALRRDADHASDTFAAYAYVFSIAIEEA